MLYVSISQDRRSYMTEWRSHHPVEQARDSVVQELLHSCMQGGIAAVHVEEIPRPGAVLLHMAERNEAPGPNCVMTFCTGAAAVMEIRLALCALIDFVDEIWILSNDCCTLLDKGAARAIAAAAR